MNRIQKKQMQNIIYNQRQLIADQQRQLTLYESKEGVKGGQIYQKQLRVSCKKVSQHIQVY